MREGRRATYSPEFALERLCEDTNEDLDSVGVLKDFECRGQHGEVLDRLEERSEEVGREHPQSFDEACGLMYVSCLLGHCSMSRRDARSTTVLLAIASLTLRSDWETRRKMPMILALALSARSSSSTATLIKALESGSRRPSWLKMRQKSFRGVGPCRAERKGQRNGERQGGGG